MRQYVYENLSFAAMKDHFDAIQASAYSVSLFTDWQNHNFSEVWLKSRTEKGQAFNAKPEFFGAKLATKNLHPIAALSAENCTEQMGVLGPWYERLPHFRMGFTPSAGKELQSEYFVPRQHAVEAILAVERLRDQITPHLLITEIRAIAADDLWMSPCYQQPCVTIHFTWKQDWPAVSQLLPVIEKELAPFQARPHWGKLFTMSPQQLHTQLQKAARVHRPNQKIRPQRQVPQRLPQHEYFHLVAEFMWSAAALLPLFLSACASRQAPPTFPQISTTVTIQSLPAKLLIPLHFPTRVRIRLSHSNSHYKFLLSS